MSVLLISNHYSFDRMLNESSLTKKCVWKTRHLLKQIHLAEIYVKPKHINNRGSSSFVTASSRHMSCFWRDGFQALALWFDYMPAKVPFHVSRLRLVTR